VLYVFPIEPIEERYSAQWWRRWRGELKQLGVVHKYVGESLIVGTTPGTVGKGEFLDPTYTNKWKALQLVEFVDKHLPYVTKDDWLLLHDAWNPQIESLAYIRDTVGPEFKIAGLLHAGTWDEHDYLSQKGLGRWAWSCEEGWLEALDLVFVATNFHKSLLTKKRTCDPDKIKVTGFPLYSADFGRVNVWDWANRSKLVVFPHRLAPEKQPEQFVELEHMYRAKYGDDDSIWLSTKNFCSTKIGYYDVLARARVVVSTALQETWGIAMLEGMMLGAVPVAPNRLSYPETMPAQCLYETLEEAVDLIHGALHTKEAQPLYVENHPTRGRNRD